MKPLIVHYDFHIDALTPETLRLSRFVEYVDDLRALFGHPDDVHFKQVRKGSAVLEFFSSPEAAPQIDTRLRQLGSADMPADIATRWSHLNALLRRDSASATLRRKGGMVLARFAGVRTPLAQEAIVHENGTLDGTVVGIKGVDDSVPVWIKTDDGAVQKCNATHELACRLAPLWGSYVRLTGKGKWRRGEDRRWTLEEFDIQSFEQPDATPLDKLVQEIRSIDDNGWNVLDDPQAAWRALRAD
ncbi:MAG TPA: hypothetical protein PLL92_16060 [Alicycliphilus sp.]|nr:hypothetical protein [Alicycliphilus sp.]